MSANSNLRRALWWAIPLTTAIVGIVAAASDWEIVSQRTLDLKTEVHALSDIRRGRQIFRHETFGDEAFWGDTLGLHRAIAGAALGGVGPGVSPKAALSIGLKVDVNAIPADLARKLRRGEVDLDAPATTVALLKLDAVVGIKGRFDQAGTLSSVGITCALCHSVVDNAFATGIGHRLDGWANRDLDVGAIIALAPDLSSVAALLGTIRRPCARS